jgi:hypothetical protein
MRIVAVQNAGFFITTRTAVREEPGKPGQDARGGRCHLLE